MNEGNVDTFLLEYQHEGEKTEKKKIHTVRYMLTHTHIKKTYTKI